MYTFHVNPGELLCKGKWLYPITEAHNWYFVKEEDREFVVQTQCVIDTYVQTEPVSLENGLPSNDGATEHMKELEENLKPLHIDDHDHYFLMDWATEMDDWDHYEVTPEEDPKNDIGSDSDNGDEEHGEYEADHICTRYSL